MADLKAMKGVSEQDRKMIEEAESLLGPEPDELGFVKNLFWGRLREDLLLPYPESPAEEQARCDQLLAELEDYLKNEHPSIQIDQDQEIPRWVIDRLFQMGALGCTIPTEYGGMGFGITGYNRVLEMIGRYCGSTAVVVSAHQSIGCKALMLFGSDEQKQRFLPKMATGDLSAFCLSEPNVGCDAGGQETRCELSPDGTHYILNGEKKWSTSGALSGLFTVMCKQKMADGKDKVTALICTPDMDGVDIFQKNRSKCGIRGTWQARIKLTNVRVPKENLLHKEGKGLNVALTCLNYGRCTLSAGMLGGARRAMDQGVKWARTRHQFNRPLSDFELVKTKLANMAALTYAMDAVLYMTTGMLDRKDSDIMVETAICKVFSSEMGWRVVNDAMQIMGGESYITSNEVERIFRDSRINLIVEGANEVMQSFIFAYGGRQLGEWMLGIRESAPKNFYKPAFLKQAIPLGLEVFLGIRRAAPSLETVHASLRGEAELLGRAISELTFQFKQMSKIHDAEIVSRQAVQARLADQAIMIHAWACTLSKLDRQVRVHGDNGGPEIARDRAAAMHFFDVARDEIAKSIRAGYQNTDSTMFKAAEAAIAFSDTQPASDFIIPEKSQTDAQGQGRTPRDEVVKKFPGDKHVAV
ncbi:MAG: acyl-CoA dehydrogenase family protein [Planctomycetota bacterium]